MTKLLKELNIETYRQFDTGRKVLETKGKVVFYNSTIPNISILSLFDLQLIILELDRSEFQSDSTQIQLMTLMRQAMQSEQSCRNAMKNAKQCIKLFGDNK